MCRKIKGKKGFFLNQHFIVCYFDPGSGLQVKDSRIETQDFRSLRSVPVRFNLTDHQYYSIERHIFPVESNSNKTIDLLYWDPLLTFI